MAVAARREHVPIAERRLRRVPRPGLLDLRDMPWWTAADQAELDVLVKALVLGIPWHLERCPIAAEARDQGLPHWCKHLSAAVEEVLDWRDTREAYSRAAWLRALLR